MAVNLSNLKAGAGDHGTARCAWAAGWARSSADGRQRQQETEIAQGLFAAPGF